MSLLVALEGGTPLEQKSLCEGVGSVEERVGMTTVRSPMASALMICSGEKVGEGGGE